MTRWMMLNGEYVHCHTHPEQLYKTEDGLYIDINGTVYKKVVIPQSVRYNITIYISDEKLTIPSGFGCVHRLAQVS